jgi:hypothetical protein
MDGATLTLEVTVMPTTPQRVHRFRKKMEVQIRE